LCYFGVHQPAEMAFDLPTGKRYRVEVIDTWNMTITPKEEMVWREPRSGSERLLRNLETGVSYLQQLMGLAAKALHIDRRIAFVFVNRFLYRSGGDDPCSLFWALSDPCKKCWASPTQEHSPSEVSGQAETTAEDQ